MTSESATKYTSKTAGRLYYYGARYYEPRTSVFLGVDPLADKLPGWSPYAYCLDNPIKLIDPNGMEPEPGGDNPWINTPKKPETPVRVPMRLPEQPSNTPNPSPSSKPSTQPPPTARATKTPAAIGQSVDVTVAVASVGYTVEAGYIVDSKGNANLFLSYGPAFGLEASVSENMIIIPTSGFETKDFAGSGTTLSGNAGIFSFAAFGNNQQGYPADKCPATYWGAKLGLGGGVGGSYQHTKTKLFPMPKMNYYQSRLTR